MPMCTRHRQRDGAQDSLRAKSGSTHAASPRAPYPTSRWDGTAPFQPRTSVFSRRQKPLGVPRGKRSTHQPINGPNFMHESHETRASTGGRLKTTLRPPKRSNSQQGAANRFAQPSSHEAILVPARCGLLVGWEAGQTAAGNCTEDACDSGANARFFAL